MTEDEIKEFFNVNKNNEKSYLKVRELFSDDQIQNNPEQLISEILKQTYGFPITFMDEGREELFTVSPEKSEKVYAQYAEEIKNGYYESLYDFTQELSDCFSNFPEDEY
ncbi:MAG: hypothetical protein MJ188_10525 [Treponema sp.]|nr:hypothetical protein [Treponema sp.]